MIALRAVREKYALSDKTAPAIQDRSCTWLLRTSPRQPGDCGDAGFAVTTSGVTRIAHPPASPRASLALQAPPLFSGRRALCSTPKPPVAIRAEMGAFPPGLRSIFLTSTIGLLAQPVATAKRRIATGSSQD